MDGWALISAVVVATGIFLALLFYVIRRFCHRPKQQQQQIHRATSIQNGISKLHQQETMFNNKRATNYLVLRRGISSKPLFSWSDHPYLITDAIENGWSRFAFTNVTSSIQSNKSIFGYCVGDTDNITNTATEIVEISWDIYQGSADFMQKIRFNPGLKKPVPTTCSVIKTALPLPGPDLGNSTPFPQEAYFEITVLSSIEDEIETDLYGKEKKNKGEGEKIKLINEKGEKVSSESLVHVTSRGVISKNEELKGRIGNKDIVDGKMEMGVLLSVGLAGGESMPLKVPGSYPGSVGFNSDGSVYLEGAKLITESESIEWGQSQTVIGCGYNPSQKKVFFTVDSKLVREIHCTTEEFTTPLYPTLSANSDITLLVNFGQTVFKYTQANLHRTPNPCFLGPTARSPIIGLDDSKELFSMGRIDAHWLDRSAKRSSAQYFGSVNRGMTDYDECSEGDLFEIVLDNNSRGRSPSVH